MRRMIKWAGMAAAGVTLISGCAHGPEMRTASLGPEGPYKIGREDVLDVSVWRDPDLSRVVPVRPDGYISLPMAGEVVAAGKTTVELEEELKAKLAPYVQAPKVTVIVHEVSSKVFVTGEVAHPGAFPLRSNVNLLQAIALAGGLSEFASSDGIVVVRGGEKGGRIPVRYSDLLKEDGQKSNVVLQPGDTVVVP